MSKFTLLVCQSCRILDCENDEVPADGALLLNQLRSLQQKCPPGMDVDIQPVGCLWICQQACSVALQSANKCTYLLASLPLESADALMQFGELYGNSDSGKVPWKKIPDVLKTRTIACIPAVGQTIDNDD